MKITYVLHLFSITTTLVSPQPQPQQYVTKLGACEHLTNDQFRCAYQKSDCESAYVDGVKNIAGEKWWQPYRLDYSDIATCGCDENTVVGACVTTGGIGTSSSNTAMSYRCAPNPFACGDGEAFFSSTVWKFPGGSWCGCDRARAGSSDGVVVGAATLYGACWDAALDKGVCALEPDGCEAPFDRWVDAVSVRDLMGQDCTCSDVVVGGCFGGLSGFQCAVSKDTCDGFGAYYTPKAAAETHLVECRLCPPGVESDTVMKGYSGAPTPAPSVVPTEGATGVVLQQPKLAASQDNSYQNSTHTILIAGTSFGVGLLVTLLCLSICFICKRGCSKKNAEKQQSESRTENGGLEMEVPKGRFSLS